VTLTERLARFTASLRFEALPEDVVDSVRLRLLDTLGLALAGSRADFAPALLAVVDGERGACTVVGTDRTAPAPLAILANGALAHGLDFDDTHAASITHASAVVLPVVLAVAEARGLDGRALITAAVAGYEAITRLGMAAPGAFHDRGWHATAACGPFAAALAAGRCHQLDADGLTNALGIAGSCASGVLEFLEDGSWVKRLHPGWAGHAGAVAATLAAGGFSGPATILEGRFGFYAAFLGKSPDPTPFETLGRRWEILRVAFKPYPCCHYNHAYLDCALELRAAHALAVDAIESIECRVPAGEVPIVCEPAGAKARPRTTYEAQFSLPFSVAAALVDGRVDVDTYAGARLGDSRVLALAARVHYVIDGDSRFPASFPGWVRVRLADGRTVEAKADDGRGGPARPLPREAIVQKFRGNAGRALSPERVAGLERAVLELDRLASVAQVTALCRA
jgi:2-methylcitrate dehydratase PrpD